MIVECPHCKGQLKEKHDEFVTERGKTVHRIHYRCIQCGKWITEDLEE